MLQSRRNFIKTAGSLTIGFCFGGDVLLYASGARGAPPGPGLPTDLRENPRINAWLEILADGRIRVLTGKIELGQGIATAVAQVAAEELELDMSQVEVLLAETGRTPDEGYTAGSNSIEASAMSVRYASAAAREKLLDLAAKKMNVPVTGLTLAKGSIHVAGDDRTLSFAEILDGRQISDEVHPPVTLKPRGQYRLVGKPVPRVENRLIVAGKLVYINDLHLPGMVHARIIRPPAYGAQLQKVDEQAARKRFPHLLSIARNGSFLGVIATNEFEAFKAQRWLQENTSWSDGPPLPKLAPGEMPGYLTSLPVKTEHVPGKGDKTAPDNRPILKAEYYKPYLMHGAIGPSCAVAIYDNGKLDVWSNSQGVYPLRETLAALLHMPAENIHVKGVPGSGCYGHNGADDAAADAALLAMAFPGKPIRLQWSREDEHAWEPYGSAMVMKCDACLDDSGRISHWNYALWSDTHGARPGGNPANLLPAHDLEKPFLARPSGFSGGAYRNAEPYYAIPNLSVEAHFFEGPLRTSSLRSLGAYANIFAIESFMDELAHAAGKDPYEFRLHHIEDPRARNVIQKLRSVVDQQSSGSDRSLAYTGTGMAFSRYKNSGAYCAVAAQVAVNQAATDVRVLKMWAVVEAGEVINPDGIKNQIEGGMIQSASWTLYEQVQFDTQHVTTRNWSTYPIMHIGQAPRVEVFLIDLAEEDPAGAGEAAQGPAAAAIVNAVFHACGKRIRHLPVLASLG